jgi:hypothetical protein
MPQKHNPEQLGFLPPEPHDVEPGPHASAVHFGVVPAEGVLQSELPSMQPRLPEAVLGDVELAPDAWAMKSMEMLGELSETDGHRTHVRNVLDAREQGRDIGGKHRTMPTSQLISLRETLDTKAENLNYQSQRTFAQAADIELKPGSVPTGQKGLVWRKAETADPTRQAEFDRRFQAFYGHYYGKENKKNREAVTNGKQRIFRPE